MNFKFLFILGLGAILLAGCSADVEDEMLGKPSSTETGADKMSSKVVERPFKSKADGNWFLVPSIDCEGLLPYSIEGTGNATHLGRFDIEGTLCAFPPEGLYFLTVKFIAANGDELIWESVEPFIDQNGQYTGGIFECKGGTGRFEMAEGTITVNEMLETTSVDPATGIPLSGTFTNAVTGTLAY